MNFKDLDVYKMALTFSITVHKTTRRFPDFEKYELGSQLRRAGISIILNIAEGHGRLNDKRDLIRFLKISLGSNNEVAVILEICHQLGYLQQEEFIILTKESQQIGIKLFNLIEAHRKALIR